MRIDFHPCGKDWHYLTCKLQLGSYKLITQAIQETGDLSRNRNLCYAQRPSFPRWRMGEINLGTMVTQYPGFNNRLCHIDEAPHRKQDRLI